jgi:uncharacterized protein (TIGR02444 family)
LTEAGGAWPDSALWDYALALYGEPGVEAACLALQDRAGTDVNLLLFATWLGATGRDLGPAGLARARQLVADWQTRLVQPLRVVRRELKPRLAAVDPMLRGPLTATRQQLAEVELALERAELIMLEELAASLPAGACDPEIAVRALLALAPSSVEHGPEIDVVLAAAFPSHACEKGSPAPEAQRDSSAKPVRWK